jgi:hypothetical protein
MCEERNERVISILYVCENVCEERIERVVSILFSLWDRGHDIDYLVCHVLGVMSRAVCLMWRHDSYLALCGDMTPILCVTPLDLMSHRT